MITKTVLQLIEEDIITLEQFHAIVLKNQRDKKRNDKKARAVIVRSKVSEALEDLLKKPGATVKHRTVWNAVGRNTHTRDEVLNAMRAMRQEGILQNIRTSNNNFQVFWAYVIQPESPSFGLIEDIKYVKKQ